MIYIFLNILNLSLKRYNISITEILTQFEFKLTRIFTASLLHVKWCILKNKILNVFSMIGQVIWDNNEIGLHISHN